MMLLSKYFDWMGESDGWRWYVALIGPSVVITVVIILASTTLGSMLREEWEAGKIDGMTLHVDPEGCHYLSRWGALVPRMGADGAQICAEAD